MTVTGGCLCGGVRFECSTGPDSASYCHCADCRRTTGSAFNTGVRFPGASFRLVKGAAKGFRKAADSGTWLTRYFCPDCGSPLYTVSDAWPDMVFIMAGALDDPSVVEPAYQLWTRSRVPWATIPAELPSYEKGRVKPT